MTILNGRSHYKPFEYPWAYDMYKKHEQMHWLPEEVELRDDIADWNNNLTAEEKNLLTHLFRFFTQADCDVASGYNNVYLPYLGKHPEIAMMMNSFAAREAVHIDAYSTLIETIGMPETIYKVFMEYQEMEDKHLFIHQFDGHGGTYKLLQALAVYSAFTEGMQLFSSFAVLMNFERHNKMKGMCNIIRWSIRDESMHVEGMTRLFRELYKEHVFEYPGEKEDFDLEVMNIAEKMIQLEDKFIDLMFEEGGIEGLTKEDVKQYIRYIANRRWNQLGLTESFYDDVTNPLEWLDWSINGTEHANFFEARVTEYSKGTVRESEVQW